MVKASVLVLAGILGGLAASTTVHATAADTIAKDERASAASDATIWKAWGGEIQFRWNRELARDYGFSVSSAEDALKTRDDGIDRLAVRDSNSLSLAVREHSFDGFRGGRLAVRGGFELQVPDGAISLREFTLRPNPDDAMILDVVSNDGIAWFYIDRMMYKFEERPARLSVLAMDLRIAPRFAERIGHPDVAGHVIAAMSLSAQLHGEGFAPLTQPKAVAGCGKWHGCEVTPGGPLYSADVFMERFSAQYYRRDIDADGPGIKDGRVVWVPSSTLRNNRNNLNAGVPTAGIRATIPGDPLGTSSVPDAANVPWHTKFSGSFDPHGNDQHPYLIWNLYRIGADGRISQIGRSGVKHAWLTTNSGCDENPGNSHILGRGCGDTYGTGNNDDIDDLGPRSEIVPALGLWGRCGSNHDKNCDGTQDDNAPCSNFGTPDCSTWAFRLFARETKIDPTLAANAGASYLFESWYIVRDDIDIFNTMQTRPVSFSWTGSSWPIACVNPVGGTVSCTSSTIGLRLGPAIDRWTPRGTNTATQRSSDIARPEGQGRVVGKVTDLGGGRYRYDYTVMNFDFAEAVITGSNPNLTVRSNNGFTDLSVRLPSGAVVTDIEFDDGDIDSANNWSASPSGGSMVWSAPAGAELNWGMLYRFSFVVNAAPVDSNVRLTTAQANAPDHVDVPTLAPIDLGFERHTVGGSANGVAGTEGAELELNGAETLSLASNGTFLFDTALLIGEAYHVTLERQPRGRSCTLANGDGVIGSADVTSVTLDCIGFGVRGTVSGVSGTDGVELRLNAGETLALSSDGAFAFATPLMTGETYAVGVTRHPTGKACEVTNGAGQIGSADVGNLVVQCVVPPTYRLGGTASGVAGTDGAELELNGTETLALASNGTFRFDTTLLGGEAYHVTLERQPRARSCTLANADGTIGSADVTSVTLDCVGFGVRGTVSGVSGTDGVELRLNAGETLTLASDGSFAFATPLMTGETYAVGVTRHPTGKACEVTNGAGQIGSADVGNLVVQCVVPPTYRLGGTASGVAGTDGAELELNGTETLALASNGTFRFDTTLLGGEAYHVTLERQPRARSCTLANADGTIGSADVTSVTLDCVGFGVRGTVSGVSGTDGVELRLNAGETLTLASDGSFAFATPLMTGETYAVGVSRHPTGKACAVTNGGGQIGSADVGNVVVQCESSQPLTYSVGGSVRGLPAGENLSLVLNSSAATLHIDANGPFQFVTELVGGSDYTVLAQNPSAGVRCQVSRGSGVIQAADVANVAVDCTTVMFTVSGVINGLQPGQSVTLRLNPGETIFGLGNGPFAFATGLANHASFAVEIVQVAGAAQCDLQSSAGTIEGANVSDVRVACEALPADVFESGFESGE